MSKLLHARPLTPAIRKFVRPEGKQQKYMETHMKNNKDLSALPAETEQAQQLILVFRSDSGVEAKDTWSGCPLPDGKAVSLKQIWLTERADATHGGRRNPSHASDYRLKILAVEDADGHTRLVCGITARPDGGNAIAITMEDYERIIDVFVSSAGERIDGNIAGQADTPDTSRIWFTEIRDQLPEPEESVDVFLNDRAYTINAAHAGYCAIFGREHGDDGGE